MQAVFSAEAIVKKSFSYGLYIHQQFTFVLEFPLPSPPSVQFPGSSVRAPGGPLQNQFRGSSTLLPPPRTLKPLQPGPTARLPGGEQGPGLPLLTPQVGFWISGGQVLAAQPSRPQAPCPAPGIPRQASAQQPGHQRQAPGHFKRIGKEKE